MPSVPLIQICLTLQGWVWEWTRVPQCSICPENDKRVVSCREKESGRMHQVLQHPVFKANPLLAITNHLQVCA